MSSTLSGKVNITIFGESHGEAVGAVIDGIKSGLIVDEAALCDFMARRSPGRKGTSARKESDRVRIISGVFKGRTTGAPICLLIDNEDASSKDYEALRYIPRPSHADYTAFIKHGGFNDYRGGGATGGRLTAPLCAAGFICLSSLREQGIEVSASLTGIGVIKSSDYADRENFMAAVYEELTAAACNKDSVGGEIKCCITGVPVGTGEPMFDGIENRISQVIFSIPAVKGIEFGDGIWAGAACGSEYNDEFDIKDGQIITKTNHCGGILGGMANGMPIEFTVYIKPTPSIARQQQSVNLKTMTQETINITGRHDPAIALRAVPCVEAAAAIALAGIM